VRFGITVIIVALLATFVAQFLQPDLGYVYIDYRGYRIEMNLVMLVSLVLLLIFGVWLLRKAYLAPRLLGEKAGRFRSSRASGKLMQGMIEVAEGNFAVGEKLLARGAAKSHLPLFNYLQAARAAHMQGEAKRRDEWLKIAYEEVPDASNAVLLTQAEFQLGDKQYEKALATLTKIDENSGKHGYALALLGRVYFTLGDWQTLKDLLPRIRKHGRSDDESLEQWTVWVHSESLAAADDEEAVMSAFKAVPKPLKLRSEILEAYFGALLRVGATAKAEKAMEQALSKEWRGFIVRLYGLVEGSDPSRQLKVAEGWLGSHPADPDLLLAAARLCLRNELWGKARSYLESVIDIKPTPEAYRAYGKLLQQMGETDAAAEAFRDGLGLVSSEPLPAIPHLKSADE